MRGLAGGGTRCCLLALALAGLSAVAGANEARVVSSDHPILVEMEGASGDEIRVFIDNAYYELEVS